MALQEVQEEKSDLSAQVVSLTNTAEELQINYDKSQTVFAAEEESLKTQLQDAQSVHAQQLVDTQVGHADQSRLCCFG